METDDDFFQAQTQLSNRTLEVLKNLVSTRGTSPPLQVEDKNVDTYFRTSNSDSVHDIPSWEPLPPLGETAYSTSRFSPASDTEMSNHTDSPSNSYGISAVYPSKRSDSQPSLYTNASSYSSSHTSPEQTRTTETSTPSIPILRHVVSSRSTPSSSSHSSSNGYTSSHSPSTTSPTPSIHTLSPPSNATQSGSSKEFQTRIEQLEQRERQLQARLEQESNRRQATEHYAQRLQSTLELSEQLVGARESEIQRLTRSLDEERAIQQKSTGFEGGWRSLLKKEEVALQDAENRVKEKDSQARHYGARLEQLSAQVNLLETNESKWKMEKNFLTATVSALEQETDKLRSELLQQTQAVETAKQQLQSTRRELERQMNTASEQLDRAKMEYSEREQRLKQEFEAEKARLQSLLQSNLEQMQRKASSEAESYSKELYDLQNQNSALRHELKRTEDTLKSIREETVQQSSASAGNIQRLERQVKELNEALEKKQRALDDSDARFDTARQEYKRALEQLEHSSVLQQERAVFEAKRAMQQQIDTLKHSLQTSETRVSELKKENDAWRADIERERKAHQSRMKELQDDLHAVEVRQKKELESSLALQKTKLEGEVNRLQEEAHWKYRSLEERFTRQQSAHQSEVLRLHGRLDVLEKQEQSLIQRSKQLEDERNQLQRQLESERAEFAKQKESDEHLFTQLQSKCQDTTRENEQLVASLQRYKVEYSSLQSQFAQAQEREEQQEKKRNEFKEEIQAYQKELLRQEQLFKDERCRIDHERRAWFQTRANLETEVQTLKAAIESTEDREQAATKRLQQQREILLSERGEREKLGREVLAITTALHQLQVELSGLLQKNSELEKELKERSSAFDCKIKTLSISNITLEEELERLRKQNQELRERLLEYQALEQGWRHEMLQSHKALQSSQRQLAEAEAIQGKTAEDNMSLVKMTQTHTAMIQKAAEEASQLRRQLTDARNDVASKEYDIKQLREQLEQVFESVEKLEAEKKGLSRTIERLEGVEKSYEQLRKEVEDMGAIAVANTELSSRVRSLQEENERSLQRIQSLEKDNTKTMLMHEHVQELLVDRDSTIRSLEAETKRLAQEYGNVCAELDRERLEIEKAKRKVEDWKRKVISGATVDSNTNGVASTVDPTSNAPSIENLKKELSQCTKALKKEQKRALKFQSLYRQILHEFMRQGGGAGGTVGVAMGYDRVSGTGDNRENSSYPDGVSSRSTSRTTSRSTTYSTHPPELNHPIYNQPLPMPQGEKGLEASFLSSLLFTALDLDNDSESEDESEGEVDKAAVSGSATNATTGNSATSPTNAHYANTTTASTASPSSAVLLPNAPTIPSGLGGAKNHRSLLRFLHTLQQQARNAIAHAESQYRSTLTRYQQSNAANQGLRRRLLEEQQAVVDTVATCRELAKGWDEVHRIIANQPLRSASVSSGSGGASGGNVHTATAQPMQTVLPLLEADTQVLRDLLPRLSQEVALLQAQLQGILSRIKSALLQPPHPAPVPLETAFAEMALSEHGSPPAFLKIERAESPLARSIRWVDQLDADQSVEVRHFAPTLSQHPPAPPQSMGTAVPPSRPEIPRSTISSRSILASPPPLQQQQPMSLPPKPNSSTTPPAHPQKTQLYAFQEELKAIADRNSGSNVLSAATADSATLIKSPIASAPSSLMPPSFLTTTSPGFAKQFPSKTISTTMNNNHAATAVDALAQSLEDLLAGTAPSTTNIAPTTFPSSSHPSISAPVSQFSPTPQDISCDSSLDSLNGYSQI